jgi:hypothetical protein
MSPLQYLLSLLFLLLATTALAAPKAERPRFGWPTADCEVHKNSDGIRDTYSLRGNNWNVSSAQLKAGIETPGTVVTGWEFKEAMNVDDIHTFKAKVRMPHFLFSPLSWGDIVAVAVGVGMLICVFTVEVAD